MTAVAIETSVLESLDFEISCQTIKAYYIMGHKVAEEPDCHRPATHSASIHQAGDCTVIDKFICETCIPRFKNDRCLQCSVTMRISNIVPLPKAP
jgi:hypothetical protein